MPIPTARSAVTQRAADRLREIHKLATVRFDCEKAEKGASLSTMECYMRACFERTVEDE